MKPTISPRPRRRKRSFFLRLLWWLGLPFLWPFYVLWALFARPADPTMYFFLD